MRSRNLRWLLVLLALATAGLAPEQSPAQETSTASDADETEDNSEFALTFSRAAGAPGEEVALPVYFTRRPGAPNVEKLTLRLSYPQSVVIYNKAEDAYLSRRAGVAIHAEAKTSGEQSVLEISFTLPNPAEKDFPSGQIAYLHFTISSEADDQTVHLKPELWIDEQAVTASNSLARVEDGTILISASPIIVGCFFFTH